MLFFILMFIIGFLGVIILKWADGTIAYNNAYMIAKAKQTASHKSWDQLWKESSLTSADIPDLIKSIEILENDSKKL